MSTAVVPFQFRNNAIRTVTLDGEHWFVAKDVAEALGYKDTTKAIKLHCKGGAKCHPLPTAGGTQQARIIREPDLYRLIVGSTLPAAQEFEAWIFEEVLPALRKTGQYHLPKPDANVLPPSAAFHAAPPLGYIDLTGKRFAGTIENGCLVLRECRDDIADHSGLPQWLADPGITISGPDKHLEDDKELLITIAQVAAMRATIGAHDTWTTLYGKNGLFRRES